MNEPKLIVLSKTILIADNSIKLTFTCCLFPYYLILIYGLKNSVKLVQRFVRLSCYNVCKGRKI